LPGESAVSATYFGVSFFGCEQLMRARAALQALAAQHTDLKSPRC
jgi:hypothetical protein